ncbi:MFS transporter, DHA1 family, bicyclomycin/chloramphenicol resistance protein [Paracoccus thiocyanatus]|uniref:Bcr/CflA family efflux transporter n=1 Tax=Paracoccus thiocyanatus TaxID=34006 RepID=A0A1N6W1Z7_9RHOB|nr:multidrug effflux MFS transporter [Paracoccus thiocyanatus]SIQ84078.1 MFS transporter, DHA1 family, bicyclomycin/chloramphenicol resistance protein [Paracoccus thiocyanatus]
MSASSASSRDVSRPEFIALIAGLMALNALAIDVMLPALPYMGHALGVADENDRHFVLTAYMLGFGAAQLAFGPLSDRFGRRAPLFVGLVIYAAAACAAVFSPNFATLLALRFVQGVGAAGTRVIATSVVRDRFHGRAMAEVMSLVFMVFMIVPVVAPAIGQVILLTGPWEYIFLFMAAVSVAITVWAVLRLPETLAPERRRPLRADVVLDGFRIVLSNRSAIMYGLAGTFIFSALFGFINTSQQIYVDIYGLGALFPLAFAFQASLMAVSSYTNSRMVRRIGMRRLSHAAILIFTAVSGLWLVLALTLPMPLWLFMTLLCVIMFMFGWSASNMNSLSLEPLGAVAGTASSVFGFIQTVGGAVLGTIVGSFFDGTVVPIAAGYVVFGLLALGCILIAEKGRLFGVGEEYRA